MSKTYRKSDHFKGGGSVCDDAMSAPGLGCAKTDSARVEHKISASSPKPDICALMITRSKARYSENANCAKDEDLEEVVNAHGPTRFDHLRCFVLVPDRLAC